MKKIIPTIMFCVAFSTAVLVNNVSAYIYKYSTYSYEVDRIKEDVLNVVSLKERRGEYYKHTANNRIRPELAKLANMYDSADKKLKSYIENAINFLRNKTKGDIIEELLPQGSLRDAVIPVGWDTNFSKDITTVTSKNPPILEDNNTNSNRDSDNSFPQIQIYRDLYFETAALLGDRVKGLGRCNGSLVSSEGIITAAHCLSTKYLSLKLVINIGRISEYNGKVKEIFILVNSKYNKDFIIGTEDEEDLAGKEDYAAIKLDYYSPLIKCAKKDGCVSISDIEKAKVWGEIEKMKPTFSKNYFFEKYKQKLHIVNFKREAMFKKVEFKFLFDKKPIRIRGLINKRTSYMIVDSSKTENMGFTRNTKEENLKFIRCENKDFFNINFIPSRKELINEIPSYEEEFKWLILDITDERFGMGDNVYRGDSGGGIYDDNGQIVSVVSVKWDGTAIGTSPLLHKKARERIAGFLGMS